MRLLAELKYKRLAKESKRRQTRVSPFVLLQLTIFGGSTNQRILQHRFPFLASESEKGQDECFNSVFWVFLVSFEVKNYIFLGFFAKTIMQTRQDLTEKKG